MYWERLKKSCDSPYCSICVWSDQTCKYLWSLPFLSGAAVIVSQNESKFYVYYFN